ncbi:MAG: glycosyltransferase family 4 protein [Bacteroidetes bacterium]|nr:glycosyltransferase family 4 protein [Bacteroidota bacterium]
MKMLFIYYDRPNYYGGPIVNARRLLPELRNRGHDVHCLINYLGSEAPSANYLSQQGVKCHLHPFDHYIEQQIEWILHKVTEVQPDVFIPNLSVAGWFSSRWVRQAGIPTIAAHRNDDAFYWAMVDEFVTGDPEWAVSGLVCVSEHLYKTVKEKKPKYTKLCVIPSGVPVTNQLSDQTGPLRLVYVGRLVQRAKRILDLIDALALVMRTRDDIIATLVGDGNELQTLQERIESYSLEDRIRIIGTIPSEKIQTILAHHHVLVLLSDYEGTPGAVMDGMAAGLVPVCLDIPGGVRELVTHGETGLLVKDRKQDFVNAIGRLANDNALRKKLATNARSHIKKYYSLSVAADRWETFCTELIRESNNRIPLVIPSKYSLPPVRPGLKREDRRIGSVPRRVLRALAHPFKRALTKVRLFY